jgi:uncharacterized protein
MDEQTPVPPPPPPLPQSSPADPLLGQEPSGIPYGTLPPPSVGTLDEERTLVILLHVLAIPLGIIGPLVIWLIKNRESARVDVHGKEAVNFHLTMLIAVACTCGFGAVIAIPLIVIFSIIAAVKASHGAYWRYPLTWRLIK